jgi:CBS domain-containing protein
MKAEKIMTRDVSCCRPDDTLNDAARIMWERDCGFVPVTVENAGRAGRLVGILTDRDVCMAAYTRGQPLAEIRVGEVMSTGVQACRPNEELEAVEAVMRGAQVHRVPIVDGEAHLLGVIALADIAREAAREAGARTREVTAGEIGETVAAISRPRPAAA